MPRKSPPNQPKGAQAPSFNLKGELKMSKIYKAYVYEQKGEFHGKYFLGEIEGINIRTNVVELMQIHPLSSVQIQKRNCLLKWSSS
jgi:hypothetical protein